MSLQLGLSFSTSDEWHKNNFLCPVTEDGPLGLCKKQFFLWRIDGPQDRCLFLCGSSLATLNREHLFQLPGADTKHSPCFYKLDVFSNKYLIPNLCKKCLLSSCSSITEVHHPCWTIVINAIFFSAIFCVKTGYLLIYWCVLNIAEMLLSNHHIKGGDLGRQWLVAN